MDYQIWNNSLLNILISLGLVVGGFILAKLIYLIFTKIFSKIASRTKSNLDDLLVAKFRSPFVFAAIIASIWYGLKRLNISEDVQSTISQIYTVLIILNFTWAFAELFSGIIQSLLDSASRKKDKSFNKNVAEVLKKITTYTTWIIGILLSLHNVGIHISTLLTGLGIGGVAVAFAAQDTMKNLFGGFMLFFDRPFNIGDRIKFGTLDGFVLTIGLRSLRIRTLDDRIVTIPNSQVVDNAIENITSEPSCRIKVSLGLTYDTTPEKMELAMNLLRKLPESVDDITEETSASFMEYGDFSMQILFVYHIRKNKDYFETISKVNLEILRQFNANKLEFAFPTQTIYTKES